MKKKYTHPTIDIVKIQMQTMLATSGVGYDSTPVNAEGAEAQGTDYQW